MRRVATTAMVVLTAATLGSPADALDGDRKGLYLAFGIGTGIQSADQEYAILGEELTIDGSEHRMGSKTATAI